MKQKLFSKYYSEFFIDFIRLEFGKTLFVNLKIFLNKMSQQKQDLAKKFKKFNVKTK